MSDKTEVILLKRLRKSLNPIERKEEVMEPTGKCDLRSLLEIAKKHAVLPLLFDAYEGEKGIPAEFGQVLSRSATTTVRSNYRLLFLTKYVTHVLQEEGIRAVLLKGAATASYYPSPELRKSGDVDILIPRQETFLRAVEILKKEGFAERKEQDALHHIELINDEGICVEVHSILAEPFESKKMNRFLETLLPDYEQHMTENDSWGISFYQPEDAYHAFYLVIHMLQHFLRAGFGLKYLCDWVVFWNREVDEKEKQTFLRLIRESGTEGFVSVLTETCVKYLGLKRKNVAFLLKEFDGRELAEDFIKDIFAAGEFGQDKRQRMVAMRGTGISAYIREFHHQMHLNYPKAGSVFLLWPILWGMTLFRFLHNNHAVRGVKGRDIIKEAGKRSRLTDKMKLFS